jgi:hypothetical protein
VLSPLQGITHRDWSRLRRADALRVDAPYRLRALGVALMARANSRHAAREEARHAGRVRRAAVRAPIFILGHYRSGTTHLHNLLARDPRFAAPTYYQASFPRTFLVTERLGVPIGSPLTLRERPHDNVRMGLNEPAEDELALCSLTFLSPHMGWHFPARRERYRRYLTFRGATREERERWKAALRWFARKLAVRHGRRLVFKSPCHTARVRLLLEAFPDARFVHIHRDPFTIFPSTCRMERRVRPLFRFQREDVEADLHDLVLSRFRETYDAYLEDRPAIPPGRLVEVSYDDLVREPLPTLARIYRGLALPDLEPARPALRAYLDSVRGYATNRHDPLPAPLRQRIAEEWEPYFDAMGYATRAPARLAASGA